MDTFFDLLDKLNKQSPESNSEEEYIKMIELMMRGHNTMVQFGSRPRYLYKFHSINDNLNKIIETGTLYFNSPFFFNDPFDSKFFADVEGIKDILPNIKSENIGAETTDCGQIYTTDQIHKALKFYNLYSSHVCCFSTERTSTLLWSHYADSHCGVCLEFDTLGDLELFCQGDYVRYVTQLPNLTLPQDFDRYRQSLTFTKSDEWSYEKEYRLMRFYTRAMMLKAYKESLSKIGRDIGIRVPFNKKSLKSVTIGCGVFEESTSIDKLELIVSLLESIYNLYPNTRFSIAKKSKSRFSLEFTDNIEIENLVKLLTNLGVEKIRDEKEQHYASKLFSK